MPPSHELLTDDYVAELLAKEANDCSLKYSAMGLDAYKSDKRPANQPKPNTRFLNNIIRDTNNHNRALLAKENAESRARLRDLEEADRQKRDEEQRKERRSKPGPNDTRKRMLGDIAAILGGPSKRHRPVEGDRKLASERSPLERDDSRSHSHRHRHRSDKEAREPAVSLDKDSDSDSDPLDDIIGPAPPSKSTVRRRGRGLISAMSGIDNRFAADYDPTIDVTPDPDDAGADDWDNAVETFRDRQKWKQQGADRLRSAGFTDEQIRKWEKGDKKDESDVQWSKAGGVREWDRGKVLDEDGRLSPEPEFGRLKGT
ncbi:pre-mRNA-splicing factor 38B [Xylaria flabelliformis]|nr:pre-mRNA-splicing factor 38B [Xylaria flabelliformis]